VAPAFDRLRFEPSFGGSVEENDGEREPEPAESCWEFQKLLSYFCATEYVTYLDRKGAQPKGCATGSVASGVLRFVRTLNFAEGFGAALADGWVAGVFADVLRIVPAALAFRAVGAMHYNN